MADPSATASANATPMPYGEVYSSIQTGGSLGMQTLDSCLKGLLAKGLISRDSAKEKAKQPENF